MDDHRQSLRAGQRSRLDRAEVAVVTFQLGIEKGLVRTGSETRRVIRKVLQDTQRLDESRMRGHLLRGNAQHGGEDRGIRPRARDAVMGDPELAGLRALDPLGDHCRAGRLAFEQKDGRFVVLFGLRERLDEVLCGALGRAGKAQRCPRSRLNDQGRPEQAGVYTDTLDLSVKKSMGRGWAVDGQGAGADLGQWLLADAAGKESGDKARMQRVVGHHAVPDLRNESGVLPRSAAGHSIAEG